MRGSPDKRALFDQAMDYLAEDYSKKVGEIQDFMRTSQGFIDTVDLENAAFDQDALDAIEKRLDHRAEQLLLSPMEKRTLGPADVTQVTIAQVNKIAGAPVPASSVADDVKKLYE
jgi:hypothetical protein